MGATIDHLGLCRDPEVRLIPRLTPAMKGNDDAKR
jgi:hypothetical protein